MRIGAESEAVLLRDISDGFTKSLNASAFRLTVPRCGNLPVATGTATDSALHESINAKKKNYHFSKGGVFFLLTCPLMSDT